jgi:hypothetical protein
LKIRGSAQIQAIESPDYGGGLHDFFECFMNVLKFIHIFHVLDEGMNTSMGIMNNVLPIWASGEFVFINLVTDHLVWFLGLQK